MYRISCVVVQFALAKAYLLLYTNIISYISLAKVPVKVPVKVRVISD